MEQLVAITESETRKALAEAQARADRANAPVLLRMFSDAEIPRKLLATYWAIPFKEPRLLCGESVAYLPSGHDVDWLIQTMPR